MIAPSDSDSILEIEHDNVGADLENLLHFAGMISRRE